MFHNAYALLLLTSLFWGGNAVAGKFALGHVSPMLLTALRWAVAAAVLLAIGLPQLRRDWALVRANLALLFTLGAVGMTVFNVALYSALHYTSAINVSIEQAALPIFIFVINFLFFRIRVSFAQIVGFVLSLAGVALVAARGDLGGLARLEINFGDGLMVAAVALYAFFTIGLRYKPAISWMSLMVALSMAAFLSSLPFAVWEVAAGHAVFPDMQGWALVGYTAFFASIIAHLFYVRGVDLIGANRAGLFVNLVPIFGTLLSVLLLGETFYIHHAVAMVLVLGGIWLAEHSGRKVTRS